MKNTKSYLELKLVATDINELHGLVREYEKKGFIHDGYSQDNGGGLYWTFLKINNGLIEETEPIETDVCLEFLVEVKKELLVKLYNFAYEQVKDDEKKLNELKEIDLLLNS